MDWNEHADQRPEFNRYNPRSPIRTRWRRWRSRWRKRSQWIGKQISLATMNATTIDAVVDNFFAPSPLFSRIASQHEVFSGGVHVIETIEYGDEVTG